MNLSPDDRDAVSRTILSEAATPQDQAAVAWAIRNRVESGEFGKSPRDVVLQRNAFEPWSLPRSSPNHPLNHSAGSPEYRNASAITDAVFGDKIPDMTHGSTYFYDPAVQSALGRKPPKWAQGEPTATVGPHQFYGGRKPSDTDAMFDAAGFTMPKETAAPASTDDMFEAAGFGMGAKPEAGAAAAPPVAGPPGTAGIVQVPGIGPPSFVDAAGKFIDQPQPAPPSLLERANEAIRLPSPTEFGRSMGEAYSSSNALAATGLSDFRNGSHLTGMGKVALGGAGMLYSPISGLINELIAKPAAKIAGPEFGERAAAAAGFALPGPGAAAAGKAAMPSSRAMNALVEAIGPENVPATVARLRANERLAPMDVSPTVQQLTQGLAVQPGPAQKAVAAATEARGAGARQAIDQAYSELGPSPQALDILDQIKARAKQVGQKEIQPALEKAGPVDVSPVITAIDAEVRPGMQAFAQSGLPLSTRQQELARLRQQLVTENGEMRIDPQRLHEIQSANGTNAYQFSKSPDAAQRQAGAGLRDINEKLVDAIDAASGGAYRPARAKFAEAKDVHEAFDRGLMLQRARQGEAGITEDSPEAWRRWAASATSDQLDAARLGALSAIQMKIGSVRNAARAGMDIPEVEFTRDKLGILFGQDKADRMLQQLRDERDIATTNSKLFQGSQTAARMKGEEALKPREIGGGNPLQYVTPVAAELLGQSQGIPFVGLGGTMALKGAHLGFQKLGQMSDLARNTAFARAATASGPRRDEVINRLLVHPSVAKKPRNALAAAFGP